MKLRDEIAKKLYNMYYVGNPPPTWEQQRLKEVYYDHADAILALIQPRFDEIRDNATRAKGANGHPSLFKFLDKILTLCTLDVPDNVKPSWCKSCKHYTDILERRSQPPAVCKGCRFMNYPLDVAPEPTLTDDGDKLHVIKCRIQSWFDEKKHTKSTVGLLHEVLGIIDKSLLAEPDKELQWINYDHAEKSIRLFLKNFHCAEGTMKDDIDYFTMRIMNLIKERDDK